MLKLSSRIAVAILALVFSAAAQPTITSLQNNYGNIPPGLPSYGIAPGCLFVIYGTGLSDPGTPVLQPSAAPGLPTTLNHSSISVTVNGVTTTPAIYYTSPTQMAAVLPSTTPVGAGTITVTYNTQPGPPASIQVTASAFSMDTLLGTGIGAIVATDGSGSVILYTSSASPGQTITIWGSGLGADTANDDRTFPLKQHNLYNPQAYHVYIGGFLAKVQYAGRSPHPGVDQVDVVVPSLGAALGCGVSVIVVAGGKSSNFGTLPVNPGGGVCSDPVLGIDGSQLTQAGSQSIIRFGSLGLNQFTAPAEPLLSHAEPAAQILKTSYSASGFFASDNGLQHVANSISLGSCLMSVPYLAILLGPLQPNAGTPITLTGEGLSAQLTQSGTGGEGTGVYYASLSSPLTGGSAYTFNNPGGNDVGPFTVTVTFPVPLTWTNENSIATVTKSQGQLITWSGGASGTYVEIAGSSWAPANGAQVPVSAGFVCLAPASDQQFTIPSYVLFALPAGAGFLGVNNVTTPVRFIAAGLDQGSASASVQSSEAVTYQ